MAKRREVPKGRERNRETRNVRRRDPERHRLPDNVARLAFWADLPVSAKLQRFSYHRKAFFHPFRRVNRDLPAWFEDVQQVWIRLRDGRVNLVAAWVDGGGRCEITIERAIDLLRTHPAPLVVTEFREDRNDKLLSKFTKEQSAEAILHIEGVKNLARRKKEKEAE